MLFQWSGFGTRAWSEIKMEYNFIIVRNPGLRVSYCNPNPNSELISPRNFSLMLSMSVCIFILLTEIDPDLTSSAFLSASILSCCRSRIALTSAFFGLGFETAASNRANMSFLTLAGSGAGVSEDGLRDGICATDPTRVVGVEPPTIAPAPVPAKSSTFSLGIDQPGMYNRDRDGLLDPGRGPTE